MVIHSISTQCHPIYSIYVVRSGQHYRCCAEGYVDASHPFQEFLETQPPGRRRLDGHIPSGGHICHRYRPIGWHHSQFGMHFHQRHEAVHLLAGPRPTNGSLFGCQSLQSCKNHRQLNSNDFKNRQNSEWICITGTRDQFRQDFPLLWKPELCIAWYIQKGTVFADRNGSGARNSQ